MAATGVRWVGAALACAVLAFAAYSCGGPRPASVDAPPASPRDVPSPHAPRAGAADAGAAATDASATTSAVADAAKRGHALNGTVRTFDGRALAGAVVRAEPTPILPRAPDPREPVEVVADAQGAFDLRGLAAGDWALLVSAEGALRKYVATVRVPERSRFDLVLPRGGVIEGTVIDETTHAPVAGARVRLRGDDRWIGDARASADGRFRIALYDLIGGDGFLIEAPGYASKPAESSVDAIDERLHGRFEVRLIATRGHTLTGAVVGPDGPIARARVTLSVSGRRDELAEHRVATTAADGRYAVEHLGDGDNYYVHAEAVGYVQGDDPDPDLARPEPPDGERVSPAETGWTAPDINMRRRTPLGRCTIEGRVVDEEERPVAGVTVSTHRRVGNVETTSGPDGAFVLADVPTEATGGGVELVCSRDGRRVGSGGAETSAGAHVTGVQLFVETPTALPHVRGKVTAPDGSAVAGARVVVLPFRDEAQEGFGPPPKPRRAIESLTGSDGAFDVALEPDDLLAIAVEAVGFAPWRAEFERQDLEKPIDVALVAARGLTGRVVRVGTDVGVAGLDVSLVREAPHDERESNDESTPFSARVVATTAADGTFRVEGASVDATLRFSGDGWLEKDAPLDGSTTDALRVEISPALELVGRAEFADGRPCAGVVVEIFAPSPGGAPDSYGHVSADGDGSFSCGPLSRGRYWLACSGGSPQVVRRLVGPFEAGTRDVRVVLVLGRTIRGRVLRPDGTPAKRVKVRAWPAERDRPNGETESDSVGAFAVGGLDDEPYTVSTEVSGCFVWTKAGVRASGDAVEIRLDEGLAVAGVLRGADGSSHNFVDLVIEPVEAEKPADARHGQTDVSGRFRITALTPGRWRIRFKNDSYAESLPDVVVEAGSENLELRTVEKPPATKDE